MARARQPDTTTPHLDPDDPVRQDVATEGNRVVGITPPPDETAADRGLSARRKRPKKRKRFGLLFWSACAWLILVLFGAITASWLPLKDPLAADPGDKLLRPSFLGQAETSTPEQIEGAGRRLPTFATEDEGEEEETGSYVLGTDGLGRDILARLVHGSRVSLIVGFAAVAIGMTAGGALGLMVGYFRGVFERVVMSTVDIVLAFPGLVLLLALVAYIGQSLPVIAVVIGVLSIPQYTRVARANTLTVAQREFVMAARAMGAKNSRVLFRELLPNVILPIAAYALIAVAVVIVLEGALSFLSLSVAQPTPTWGAMISEGKRHLRSAPHVALIPSAVMFLTVLSLNFVGDSLRSIFDVKESGL